MLRPKKNKKNVDQRWEWQRMGREGGNPKGSETHTPLLRVGSGGVTENPAPLRRDLARSRKGLGLLRGSQPGLRGG